MIFNLPVKLQTVTHGFNVFVYSTKLCRTYTVISIGLLNVSFIHINDRVMKLELGH